MFAYIKGKLDYKMNDYVVVEAHGVGYKIFTALSTINNIGQAGQEVKLYTHYYVREDTAALYGFASMDELGMFEMLLGVSGVGPKAAISLLSALSPSRFALAVVSQDAKSLTKAQGIGTKMAQRIILELKDKISKEQLNGVKLGIDDITDNVSGDSVMQEAVSALMVLGYAAQEASKAVSAVYKTGMCVEDTIMNSLKSIK